jgi:transposase-like protein
MHCPKCQSGVNTKAGFVQGVQRYRCKGCGCQYTRSQPKGDPIETKLLALSLYLKGLSIRAIGRELQRSAPTILTWLRSLKHLAEKRPTVEKATVVELDELCTFLTQKKPKSGYGWLFVEKQEGRWTGKWVVGELER